MLQQTQKSDKGRLKVGGGGKTQVTTALMAMIQFLLVLVVLFLLIPFMCFID